jgi:hypothetical protein
MRTVHAFVHHEYAGLNSSAFTGLENHRTDGQFRRSAALHDFDIWLLFESQSAIACVANFDGEGAILAKLDIPIIDFLLIYGDRGCSATSTTSISKENCCDNEQHTAQRHEHPGKILPLFLLSVFFTLFVH